VAIGGKNASSSIVVERWASPGPGDLVLGNSVSFGGPVIVTDAPLQLRIPRSAPGEPEPDTPNMSSSSYFHLIIYSGSLALSVGINQSILSLQNDLHTF
jgi:hypothetical protein